MDNLQNILASILGVVHTLVSESAIEPQTKSDLHATIADARSSLGVVVGDVGKVALDAPQEIGALAGGLAGDVAGKIPGGALFAPEAEAGAQAVVTDILNGFEAIFLRHNKNTIAAIGHLVGADTATVATAQDKLATPPNA